jgi:hypothetical protein
LTFGDKTIRDGKGETVGACRLERGVYVRRDNEGTILWMVKVPSGW